MSRTYLVGGVRMSGKRMIDYAEERYACQAGEHIKFTSVAAAELRKHGIDVEDERIEKPGN